MEYNRIATDVVLLNYEGNTYSFTGSSTFFYDEILVGRTHRDLEDFANELKVFLDSKKKKTITKEKS